MGDSFMAQLEAELLLNLEALVLPSEEKCVGLVVVDEVNGFCTVGAGNMTPKESVAAITEMVKQTDYLAEQFSAQLLWLGSDPITKLMWKDCINAFVGGIRDDGSNVVIDWLGDKKSSSAQNHGIMKPLEDVFVFSKAHATYDLLNDVAKTMNAYPHPQDLIHYMGLYFAKSRGAQVVKKVILLEPTS